MWKQKKEKQDDEEEQEKIVELKGIRGGSGVGSGEEASGKGGER